MSVIFLSSIEHPSVWHLLNRSRTQHVIVSKTRQGNIFHSPRAVEALVYPRDTIKYLCLPSYQSPISPVARGNKHIAMIKYADFTPLHMGFRDGCFALEGTVP